MEALIAGTSSSAATADGEGTIPGTPSSEPMTTALWSSGTLIPVNTGTLTGPGTTNFVPDNTNGTAGLQNSTRFFEVNLRNAGTTFLTGTTATIDRLNVRGASSGLNIRAGAQLNTTISSYVDNGTLTVNGVLDTTSLFVLLPRRGFTNGERMITIRDAVIAQYERAARAAGATAAYRGAVSEEVWQVTETQDLAGPAVVAWFTAACGGAPGGSECVHIAP
jgi:hypothetical protein